MRKYGIGVIGCGRISGTYLTNMTTKFSILNVVGVSDLIEERSAAKAKEFNVRQMTNDEIYNSDEIDIVVNITYPLSHHEVTCAALKAGKHVLCEKMMAVDMAQADEQMALANKMGKHLVIAPDTFLGAGLQTCRKLIDAGMIGEPRTAVAHVIRGTLQMEVEPVNNRMVLLPGGGIPFDMGGYYLSSLVNMLGPISRVSGFARPYNKEFLNVNNPNFGQHIDIETPTVSVGTLEFKSGVLGTFLTSSESFPSPQRLEIHGTEGILHCPDPNTFGGPVIFMRKPGGFTRPESSEVPLTHGYSAGCNRGLGVAELAWSIEKNRTPRLQLGHHNFEAICAMWMSGEDNKTHTMKTMPERPAALPSGFVDPPIMETALAL